MKVSLNYGHTSIALDIPDKNYMGTLSPKEISEVANPDIEAVSYTHLTLPTTPYV